MSESNVSSANIRMYVVYDHPSDYPNCFVVRLWKNGQPTLTHILAESLEQARKMIPNGLVRIPRHVSDDPVIVETWV